MDVGHAVVHDSSNLLQPFVRSHSGNGISLDEDVGAGEELESFQGRPLGAQDTLTTLHESFLVANLAADLDDVACISVLENFEGLPKLPEASARNKRSKERRLTDLLHRYTSRKQLDKVARFEDCSWVKGFSSGLDRHATLDQVKSTGNSKLLQSSCDHGPCLLQVNLTVFGEKSGKGRFLCETPTEVVIGFEWFLLSQVFKSANENFLK